MRRLAQILTLSVAFALATLVLGWWIVPALAFAWGVLARSDIKPGKAAALAAGLGWAWLLMWTAVTGPAGELARRAAGVLAIPTVVFVAVTMLFPMMLAWSAGVVGAVAARIVRRD